jgi:hypothetical protein
MEAQGYNVKDNIMFQDNNSAILLERNGKASSSKRTKHINIRYFFITDRIRMNEVSVVWCPTGDMIGDYATKPLQGALFKNGLEISSWEWSRQKTQDQVRPSRLAASLTV